MEVAVLMPIYQIIFQRTLKLTLTAMKEILYNHNFTVNLKILETQFDRINNVLPRGNIYEQRSRLKYRMNNS
jgi:hypothetical protein